MSSKYARQGLWGLGGLLALAVTGGMYFISVSLHHILPNHSKITVKGYTERKITSNHVTWQGGLVSRSSSLKEAYEKLEQDLNILSHYLKQRGIREDELNVSAIQTSIYYKYIDKGVQTTDIESYQLKSEFTVHSDQVALVSQIADQITHLIKDGLEINSYKPQYFYTKMDELKIVMLGEAAKDALARAHQLASNSGSQVGKLRTAQQGVFQITPAFSTLVSDYGENDTSTIEKSMKAVVTMEYGIQ